MEFLFIICEGKTELNFVWEVLVPQIQAISDISCVPIQVGTGTSYGKLKNFIKITRERNPYAYITTMTDFCDVNRFFPGFDAAKSFPLQQRILFMQNAMKDDLADAGIKNILRIIPHYQLYQFEALLFSNVDILKAEFGVGTNEFEAVLLECDAPENINGRPDMKPSHRIEKIVGKNAYNKPTDGNRIAKKIGLETIMDKCPHFRAWLLVLQQLNPKK